MLFPKVDASLRQQQINCVMRNVEEDMQMCEWAGVSFGDEFAYMLQKSLKVKKTFRDCSGRNLQGTQAPGSLSSLERSMERSRITGLPTDGSTTWRRTRLHPLNREVSGSTSTFIGSQTTYSTIGFSFPSANLSTFASPD